MKNKNKTLIVILLLLLAMAIYYLLKNSQQGRVIPSDPFVETDADLINADDILDIDDLVLSDDGIVATTSGCCEGVAYNYDPSCLTDPNCNCDMSLCGSMNTCYGACNSGFGSVYTSDTCGQGFAVNYPYPQAPYCQNNQA